jgi:predicted negative regulator of RcsB-dependent stress response
VAAEIRGDALLAQKKLKEAAAAYDESLTHFDAASPRRSVVEMKRDDIAIAEGT